MSGKIPSKTQFTREAGEVVSAMDVLGYLTSTGVAKIAGPSTDVDFVLLSTAAAIGDALSCDPQPSIANLTCPIAVTAGDKLLAATAGGVRTYPGATARDITAATTDIVTLTAHGLLTGDKVRLTNSGGALPAGLAAATDYFVIKIDADTFNLASSLANALAGTAVDVTDTGTGTHSLRLYGEYTLVGKALETGVAGQKIGVLFDKRYVLLP